MFKCAALLTINSLPARSARSQDRQTGAAATATAILALFSVVGVSPVRAEFVPGYVYVADSAVPPCFDGGPPDRIWEVDPATGESRVFATIPEEFCGGLTGLTFTPDGQYLRASAAIAGSILEIDGAGNVGVALDREDGLVFPIGASNLAYDRAGNFWVGDFFPARVLRFPSASGPPRDGFGWHQFLGGRSGHRVQPVRKHVDCPGRAHITKPLSCVHRRRRDSAIPGRPSARIDCRS